MYSPIEYKTNNNNNKIFIINEKVQIKIHVRIKVIVFNLKTII